MPRPLRIEYPGAVYHVMNWRRARQATLIYLGNAEKIPQRRSRQFVVLTYGEYAPRVKQAAALLDELF